MVSLPRIIKFGPLFLLVLLTLGAPGLRAQTRFSARLEPDTAEAGDPVSLILLFEGGQPRQIPNLPQIPGVKFGVPSRQQSAQIVNGRVSSSFSLVFPVTAGEPGTFTIPPIQVDMGGQFFTSQPLALKVTKSTLSDLAFLRLQVPKRQPYIGEAMMIEMAIYVQNAQDISVPQIQSEGFVVGHLPPFTRSEARVGNLNYHVISFKIPVAPARVGPLSLGPATCDLTILYGRAGFFGLSQSKRVSLTSEVEHMEVRPLPTANRPADFNGAIGSFALDVSASPTNVAVGDPITVHVRLTGHGAFDSILPPAQKVWRDFKTYAPSMKSETDSSNMNGSKTFEQVISALSADVKEIPALAFSFFDPERNAYQTSSSASIPLSVRPAAATPQPTVFSGNETPTPRAGGTEIVHIKPHLGAIQSAGPPLFQKPWFLALQGLAPTLWLAALGWRRWREKLAANPALRRRLALGKSTTGTLRKLSAHASAGQAEDFLGMLFHLLQQSVGAALDLPASSITEIPDAELQNRGMSAESARELRELFQTCTQTRYARAGAAPDLTALVPRVRGALDELRRLSPVK